MGVGFFGGPHNLSEGTKAHWQSQVVPFTVSSLKHCNLYTSFINSEIECSSPSLWDSFCYPLVKKNNDILKTHKWPTKHTVVDCAQSPSCFESPFKTLSVELVGHQCRMTDQPDWWVRILHICTPKKYNLKKKESNFSVLYLFHPECIKLDPYRLFLQELNNTSK